MIVNQNNIFSTLEKQVLVELITNEQLKNLIPKNEYGSDKYTALEELKVKIRNM